MKISRATITVLILGNLLAPAEHSYGQVAKAAVYVAESKAARAFAGILAGYFFGKGMDKLFDSYGKPDQKEIDSSLIKLQMNHPEFRHLFGSLRRSIGPDTDKVAFEGICLDVVEQFDRSQMRNTMMPAPFKPIPEVKTEWPTLSKLDLSTKPDPLIAEWIARHTAIPGREVRLTGLFNDSPLALNPGLRTWALPAAAPSIVGAWSFDYHIKELGFGDSYLFFPGGKVTRFQALHDEVFAYHGTYAQDGSKLTITWQSGVQEVGEVEILSDGHLKYKLTPTALDLPIDGEFTLTRVSDLGTFSMVVFKNPTSTPIGFFLRWANTDGSWSAWTEREIAPDSEVVSTSVGGFYCVVGFARYPGDVQGREYALPFSVTNVQEREQLLPDRRFIFRIDSNTIDLKTQLAR